VIGIDDAAVKVTIATITAIGISGRFALHIATVPTAASAPRA